MSEYTVSDVSARSPEMSDEAFARFVEDIKANGQLVPIWVNGDEVIDGRKRLKACQILGIKPKTIDAWPGQDAEALSRSLNALRTHYTTGQLAMYAAERATATQSDGARIRDAATLGQLPQGPPLTQRQAALEVGVDHTSVVRANAVKRDGAPEVSAAVKAGKLTLHAARQIVKEVPKREQPAVVKKVIESSKGKVRQTSAAAVINVASQAGRKVQTAPPLTRQWNELLNQAEFAADNLEASADRAATHENAVKWLERVRSIRTTLSKVIHIMEARDESQVA